jgi:dTDP-4-amino-4,6-dideoxygalactose transaminase
MKPPRVRPFAPWPCFSDEETEAVRQVLLSGQVNYWTGEHGRAFEHEFASWVGVPHAVAVANGTVALEIAVAALDLGPGDEVIVPARTFVATASAVVRAGARPVFADVDAASGNLCATTMASVLSDRTRAVVCVHVGGIPCDMDPIVALAKQHGLAVIEDCAQAHGATYKGRSVGSLGDIAAWSFCQDKIISTGGEGGMITTRRRDLWEKAWALKEHGTSPQVMETSQPASSGFVWQRYSFGTNGRMTEMQAVLGRSQLKKLPAWRQRRQAHARQIDEVARRWSRAVHVPVIPDRSQSAEYKHHLFLKPEALRAGWTRDRVVQAMADAGIPCYHGICPEVYREPAFANTPWRPAKPLDNARRLGESSLMLLVHPTLTDDNIADTCRVLDSVLSEACR